MNVEVFIADCQEVPVKIVVDPPKETDEPFIVIAEFVNLELAIDPASLSFVTALLFIFAVVTALLAIFASTTEPSGNVNVPADALKVAPAGTEIVSPESPSCKDVPDCGITLSTSN